MDIWKVNPKVSKVQYPRQPATLFIGIHVVPPGNIENENNNEE